MFQHSINLIFHRWAISNHGGPVLIQRMASGEAMKDQKEILVLSPDGTLMRGEMTATIAHAGTQSKE